MLWILFLSDTQFLCVASHPCLNELKNSIKYIRQFNLKKSCLCFYKNIDYIFPGRKMLSWKNMFLSVSIKLYYIFHNEFIWFTYPIYAYALKQYVRGFLSSTIDRQKINTIMIVWYTLWFCLLWIEFHLFFCQYPLYNLLWPSQWTTTFCFVFVGIFPNLTTLFLLTC